MFSTLPKTYYNSSVTFIFSSPNAFNLDLSKKLSFGKELNGVSVTEIYRVADNAENQSVENADVAFVKWAVERNKFFEKKKQSVMYDEHMRANQAKD